MQAHSRVCMYTYNQLPPPPLLPKVSTSQVLAAILSLSTPAIHTYTGTCLAAPYPPPHLLRGQGPGPKAGHTWNRLMLFSWKWNKRGGAIETGRVCGSLHPASTLWRHKVACPGKGRSFCQQTDRQSKLWALTPPPAARQDPASLLPW